MNIVDGPGALVLDNIENGDALLLIDAEPGDHTATNGFKFHVRWNSGGPAADRIVSQINRLRCRLLQLVSKIDGQWSPQIQWFYLRTFFISCVNLFHGGFHSLRIAE